MPFNISTELAEIIGTKKGEQVCNDISRIVFSINSLEGFQAASDQEAVGLPEGEEPAGVYNNSKILSNY